MTSNVVDFAKARLRAGLVCVTCASRTRRLASIVCGDCSEGACEFHAHGGRCAVCAGALSRERRKRR